MSFVIRSTNCCGPSFFLYFRVVFVFSFALALQLSSFEAKVGEKEQELSSVEAERDSLGVRVEALTKQVEVREEEQKRRKAGKQEVVSIPIVADVSASHVCCFVLSLSR